MPRKLTTKAITDDAITADKIVNNAVTADKIVAGAVTADIPSQGITTDKIADLGVTHAKLHNTMDLSSKTVTLPSLSSLNTTGAVGIGTTSPSGNLEISASAPILQLNANSQTTHKKRIQLSASQYSAGDFNIQQMNDDGTTVIRAPLTITNGSNASETRVGIHETSPDSNLHVSGNVKVGSAASSAWAASVHDQGGLDVIVGSGSHALQLWDDNYQTRPRFEVARDGHVWAGQNMQFHEDNTSTTAPFNITNSSSTQNFFNITTYGSGNVNETYRHCYNINADAHWVHFTGGGGNTVFTTTAYIGGEHYKDITVWTITQYYSDLKIKVVQDNGSTKSIWVAGDTYQDNVYSLRWRVTPIRPCSIEHNPSSSQSAVYMVHHASGGEQFTSTSGASSGSGPSTY